MLELLLTTYAFCYHFQSDDPLIQLVEDYKWVDFFDFHWRLGIDGLSIGLVTRYPWRSTLQYLYASSRNLIKNGSVWINSNQYGIITSCPFYIFSLVDDNRYNTNNLCSFNISWPTEFKKKNSLFLCLSYGFHNYRN
uniref:NADH-plastoquinone oxidoreductase subunit 4 n=1 Tax=Solanum glutinosum TaxID=329774 RepID=UPI001FCD1E8C|nr:NADH-plastoquinone oxidoreductase subunit 4 [Solanum glutinosum]UNZ89978.1 NADH-plastoquinone oxidoreductase subunit 4 [Solanum glutinosum]